MSTSTSNPPEPPSRTESKKSVLDIIASVVGGVSAVVRKAPVAVAFVIIAIVLYFRQFDQPGENFPQFDDPTVQKEPAPPTGLSKETASAWACVQRTDSQLSNGLWADIYYGMEARVDGKLVTAKVTEKWKSLSEDKRKTVAQLVVDTWIENAQALQLFSSRDEIEEVVLKQLPDDQTVAAWKPSTGVRLFDPRDGA